MGERPDQGFVADDRLHASWRIVILVLATIVAVQAASQPAELLLPQPWSFAVSGLAMGVVALVVGGWLARRVDRRPLSGYGLSSTRSWWRGLVAGLAIGFGMGAAAFITLLVTGQARIAETASPGDETSFAAAVVPLAVYWAGVSLWEELAFRGMFVKNAAEGFGRRLRATSAVAAALGVSAVVFAAGHANQFLALDAPPAVASLLWLALGILLGLAYVRTGSLAVPIGIHLAVNASFNTVFGLTGELNESLPMLFRLEITGSDLVAAPGGIITIAAAVAGIVVLELWVRLRRPGVDHSAWLVQPPADAADRAPNGSSGSVREPGTG